MSPYKQLWLHINKPRRRQFVSVLFMMIFASFIEVISLGAVIPFLAVLTNPEQIFAIDSIKVALEAMGYTEPNQIAMPITLFFVVAAIIAGLSRIALAWMSVKLAYGTGADLSLNIYRRTLHQPYETHLNRNSSEVITGIMTKVNGVINNNLMPCLTICSSGLILGSILLALIAIDPAVSLSAMGGFGLVYGLIAVVTKKIKVSNGVRITTEATGLVKALQEGLGGIRDILLDGSQKTYTKIYQKSDASLRDAQAINLFLAQSPRFVVEALGMSLIAGLAFYLVHSGRDFATAIPVLGALAIGAQRILPLMQQLYAAWSAIQSGGPMLRDTLVLLEQPLPSYLNQPAEQPLSFKHSLGLQSVSFKYKTSEGLILQNIDLEIKKGERIGLIGTTGSGKSTLTDIIMALLTPGQGQLLVDGSAVTPLNYRSWQQQIAHVPQAIFLADATIEENIAFGVEPHLIDSSRVVDAARKAQISELIDALPDRYKSRVGERGMRLSGGQRQRIGIARALYKQAGVIILDEATSALDTDTESAVMSAIEGLNDELTVIIVAHRLSTLKKCDRIIELDQGRIVASGNYEQLVMEKA